MFTPPTEPRLASPRAWRRSTLPPARPASGNFRPTASLRHAPHQRLGSTPVSPGVSVDAAGPHGWRRRLPLLAAECCGERNSAHGPADHFTSVVGSHLTPRVQVSMAARRRERPHRHVPHSLEDILSGLTGIVYFAYLWLFPEPGRLVDHGRAGCRPRLAVAPNALVQGVRCRGSGGLPSRRPTLPRGVMPCSKKRDGAWFAGRALRDPGRRRSLEQPGAGSAWRAPYPRNPVTAKQDPGGDRHRPDHHAKSWTSTPA